MRRLLGTGIALLALLGATVVAAPGAQAAVSPSFITLLGPNCVPSKTSVVGNPGSKFSILTAGCGTVFFNNSGGAPISPTGGFIANNTVITLGASGTGSFTLSSLSPVTNTVITVTVTTDPIPAPTLHDDLQQVGVPASGDCADVPIETGHYPGAPIGGWSKSWSQWINGGKGGPVCTRELEESSDGTIVLIG